MTAAIALFLALILALSSGHKLVARQRLAPVTARLAGAPLALGQPLLLTAATAEALCAVGLVIEPLRAMAAAGAAALWLGYGLMLLARRGQVLDCGCDLVAREKPVDAFAIVRPLVLSGLAAVLVFALPATWSVDTPFGALALLALWFAAAEIAHLPHAARLSERNRT